MTYLEARRIEALFTRYRALAVDYWAAVQPVDRGPHGWMAGAGAPLHAETEKSRPIRRELTMLFPEVEHWAECLGVGVRGQSYPPAAVGGPVLPFNFLACVTDTWVGHRYVSQDDVLDAIDRSIGAAGFVKRRLLHRLLKPWCWLIDVPALVVGWPFYVMRKAGVPDKIVDSTGVQVIKAILAGLIAVAGFAYAAYTIGLSGAVREFFARIAAGR